MKTYEYRDASRTFMVHAPDLETAILRFGRVKGGLLDVDRITELSLQEEEANAKKTTSSIIEGVIRRPKGRR